MKKLENQIVTYQFTESIYVDVERIKVKEDDVLQFWLYHKDYSIKELMIGIKKDDIGTGKTWDTIEDVILLEIEDSVASYYVNYIEQDDALEDYHVFYDIANEFLVQYYIDLHIGNFVSKH